MKKALFISMAGILLILFGWYLISPLFINSEIHETLPSAVNSSTNLHYVSSGVFVDADRFHKVSGNALILDSDGKKYLRFENFTATNGPDLKVYLTVDLDAKDYISLGALKGNVGDQNYELNQDIDLAKYDHVLIWCEKFSVLFGYADLD